MAGHFFPANTKNKKTNRTNYFKKGKQMVYLKLKHGSVLETDAPQYHPEAERITKKEYRDTIKKDALKFILDTIKPLGMPKKRIHFKLNHVSRSGMLRRYDAYVINQDSDRLTNITYAICNVMGVSHKKENGIPVQGCGFSGPQHIAEHISYALFGKPDAISYTDL